MFNLNHRASQLARRVFRPGHSWSQLVPGLLLIVWLCSSAAAQTVTGTISGTVVDPNGAVVSGATVTLTNDRTNEKRDLTTNESGRFSFASVQPGVFTIRIEHQGFETMLRTKVVLSANEALAVGEISLKTGQVTETVTVTSEGQAVEKESSDLTARLTSDQISLISTKGRDITSLLRLIPGTSNDDDIEAVGEGFGTNLPNISGQRGRSTVTTIDGLNASEPSGSNKISMTINQDAVAEVKVLRNNYAAEYGNNGGAMITIVSKGGGKEYRGSAYYFLRNESLNANSFFNNKAGLGKALYRHKIPGFNIGGPLPLPRFGEGGPSLMRNKAFFFVSMERPHTVTPTDPVTVTVPTALERIGDFSKSITGVDKNGNPTSNHTIASGDTVKIVFTAPLYGQGNKTLQVYVYDATEPYTWRTAENRASLPVNVRQPAWQPYAIYGSVIGVIVLFVFGMYARRKIKAGEWRPIRGRRRKEGEEGEKRPRKEVKEEKKRL